ncbi:unnamed protein product, partial [Heterosigma akashiwo]
RRGQRRWWWPPSTATRTSWPTSSRPGRTRTRWTATRTPRCTGAPTRATWRSWACC